MRGALGTALALLWAAGALAAEQAGVSAAVRGRVELSREQLVGHKVSSGEAIFLQDRIRSEARSGMQILLLDETVFTIGPESELIVDEFVYDPASGAGKLAAEVTQGLFRFVTGKIAEREPEAVNLKLPAGNIGIRGTVLAGEVRADQSALVFLLAAGPRNDLGVPVGAFEASNAGGSVMVRTPGFGVELLPGQPPRLLRVPRQRIAELTARISDPEGRAGPAAGALGEAGLRALGVSGLARAAGREGAGATGREARRLDGETDDLIDFTETALVQGQRLASTTGIASVADLVSIAGGIALYDGTANTDDGGDYTFRFTIDFGTQTVAADLTNVNAPSLGIFGDSFNAVLPFGAGQGGDAVYQFTGAINNMVGAPQPTTVDASFQRDPAGTPPNPPGSVDHSVTILSNPPGQVVTGGAVGSPRTFP